MRQAKFKVAYLVFGIMFLSFLSSSANKDYMKKIDPDIFDALSNKDDEETVSVLVTLSEQADLSEASKLKSKEEKTRFVYEKLVETAERSQQELVQNLEAENIEYQRFYITNAVALHKVQAKSVIRVAQLDEVARINLNPIVKQRRPELIPDNLIKAFNEGESTTAVGDNIQYTGAEQVWDEYKNKGEGIVIAGQDTGVEWEHPALIKQYRGNLEDGTIEHNYNWHDAIKKPISKPVSKCGYDTKAPCDDNAHGTHTVGTIVGDDGKGNTIGMAPKAQWIACRNMDAGDGRPSTYIDCFEFFLAPYPSGGNPFTDGKPEKAPHIINNSWGCPPSEKCKGDEILPVVQALKAAGIMVVVSAGNEGPSCSTIENPPAFYTGEVLSVGAYDHRRKTIASFSSRGPSKFDGGIGPDVVAPGVSIRSAVPGKKYEQGMWSGTSMAGPHVAGQVALMWAVHPSLIGDIDRTIEIIRKTSTPLTTSQSCGGVSGNAIPNNTLGWGSINVYKAIKEVE